jgi:hypothetical protein
MLDNFIQKSQPLLYGMVGALIIYCLMTYMATPAKVIATVDVLAITQQFAKAEHDKHLTEEAIRKDSLMFGQQLEATIKQFAKNHPHIVLLPKEAVMAGATDYTDIIIKQLDRSLEKDIDLS